MNTDGHGHVCDFLIVCLQLRGYGSHSELGEVEGSRRYLKVLLAEDNLINMKVHLHQPSIVNAVPVESLFLLLPLLFVLAS